MSSTTHESRASGTSASHITRLIDSRSPAGTRSACESTPLMNDSRPQSQNWLSGPSTRHASMPSAAMRSRTRATRPRYSPRGKRGASCRSTPTAGEYDAHDTAIMPPIVSSRVTSARRTTRAGWGVIAVAGIEKIPSIESRRSTRSVVVPSERLAKVGGNARSSRKAGVTGAAGTHAAGTIPLEDCGDHR